MVRSGKLILIGGAEDKTGVILKKVASLAGGGNGHLVVAPLAAQDPGPVAREYLRAFRALGVGRVSVLEVSDRLDAFSACNLRLVSGATGLFFTGGDQLRITALLGGSPLERLLRRLFAAGVMIAGTSAGASAMSRYMIIGGPDEEAPKKCTTNMAPGLGLLVGAVIDQHFAQRGRLGRLLSALAQNPRVLGIGIDENTAIVVSGGRQFEVIGAQTVTVLDGRGIMHTNASEEKRQKPLAIGRVLLHVLPSGYRFDLRKRCLVSNLRPNSYSSPHVST